MIRNPAPASTATTDASPGKDHRVARNKPIGITMGDPSGIGPEIVLKALAGRTAAKPQAGSPEFIVYGDPSILRREAANLGIDPAGWTLVETSNLGPGHPLGVVDAASGDAAYRAIQRAIAEARAGRIGAVVTSPISKAALNLAGHRYPGHTEILAEAAGGVPVRMMLANPELMVVLVTIHEPLRQAITSLETGLVEQTIRLTDGFLKRTGTGRPRIGVAGLNPHAGEGGLLGDEESAIIAPAIEACRRDGIDASGPHAPDTVFMRARGKRDFDVVVAMYHDQGLIPVKYLGIDDGVNITIGLPFVRTSPDHGTAFDLAGRGVADPSSLLAAIDWAVRLASGAIEPRSDDARLPQ